MLPRMTLLMALILLASCAHRTDGLPVCDGAHRRPANPHGSVLVVPVDTPLQAIAQPGTDSAPADVPTGGCA